MDVHHLATLKIYCLIHPYCLTLFYYFSFDYCLKYLLECIDEQEYEIRLMISRFFINLLFYLIDNYFSHFMVIWILLLWTHIIFHHLQINLAHLHFLQESNQILQLIFYFVLFLVSLISLLLSPIFAKLIPIFLLFYWMFLTLQIMVLNRNLLVFLSHYFLSMSFILPLIKFLCFYFN